METVADARGRLAATLVDGGIMYCPVCDGRCHNDPRNINRHMGLGLVLLRMYFQKYPSSDWCHMEDWFQSVFKMQSDLVGEEAMAFFVNEEFKTQRRREVTRLKHWGMLVRRPIDPNSVVNGFWCITATGIDFVAGRISVPKKKWIRNDEVQSVSTELVTIHDVLAGPGFTLEDLHNLVRP